jgi:hypothetical protein
MILQLFQIFLILIYHIIYLTECDHVFMHLILLLCTCKIDLLHD